MSRKVKSSDSQNDITNLVSIEAMANKAMEEQNKKYLQKLEQDNIALSQTVDKLMAELAKKDSEIQHLYSLLAGNAQIVDSGIAIPVSDEEMIVMKQIERLKQDSMVRHLSLDEMKMLDLAIKNKRLVQGKSTTFDAGHVKLPNNTNELLKIASKPLKKNEE